MLRLLLTKNTLKTAKKAVFTHHECATNNYTVLNHYREIINFLGRIEFHSHRSKAPRNRVAFPYITVALHQQRIIYFSHVSVT